MEQEKNSSPKTRTRSQVKKNMENSKSESGSKIRILERSEAIKRGMNPIVILNRVNHAPKKKKKKSGAISKGSGGKRVPLSKICGYCKKTFSSGSVRLTHEMIHKPKEFHCPHAECARSFTYAQSLQSHLNHAHSDARPHPCKFPACGASFKALSALAMHTRIHQGLRPYICPHSDCKKSFTQKGGLQEHLNCVHATGENSFACTKPNCGKKLKTAKTLGAHMRQCHGEERFKCPLCPRRFREPTNLDLHMRSHTKEKPYKCSWPGCSNSFSCGSSLKIHLRVHTGQKPYTCRYPESGCRAAFSVTSSRKIHEQRHHVRIKTFPCKFKGCQLKFFTTTEVTSHLRSHTEEKPHKCATCGRHYKSPCALRMHQMKEHQIRVSKVFSCPHDDCPKIYYLECHFKEHMKSHDKIRKCKFSRCERTFDSYKNLTSHYKEAHQGEKRLKCPKEDGSAGCAHRIFRSRRDWIAHIRRRHSPELEEAAVAKYWCTFDQSECNKYFPSKIALELHMRCHTGERPFKCLAKSCSKSFRQKPHLDEHLKRVHRQRRGR